MRKENEVRIMQIYCAIEIVALELLYAICVFKTKTNFPNKFY